MTLTEAKARYEKWSAMHDAYRSAYSEIVSRLGELNAAAGNAWLRKYTELEAEPSASGEEELRKLSAEHDLTDFAYKNARQEYCTEIEKFYVRREAARYDIEDLERATA